LNFEGVASLGHLPSLLIASLNSELSRESVEVSRLKTRAIGDRGGSVSTSLNEDVNRRALYVVVVELLGGIALNDIDVIDSRVARSVGDGIGTITIVLNISGDEAEIGILNVNLEKITTSAAWATIGANSNNTELRGLSSLVTLLNTGSLNVGFEGRGHVGVLANVDTVRGLGNRLTEESNLDDVLTMISGVPGGLIETVLLINYFAAGFLTIRIDDANSEGVTTTVNANAVLVASLNSELSGLVSLSVLNTRTIDKALSGIRGSTVDHDGVGRLANVLTVEGNADIVLSLHGGLVFHGVGAIAVIDGLRWDRRTVGGTDFNGE